MKSREDRIIENGYMGFREGVVPRNKSCVPQKIEITMGTRGGVVQSVKIDGHLIKNLKGVHVETVGEDLTESIITLKIGTLSHEFALSVGDEPHSLNER